MRRCLPFPYRSSHNLVRVPSAFRRYAIQADSAAALQFGQPVHETHPHLLEPGELTPGISALEYAQRRTRLAAQLPSNGLVVIPAAELKYRSGAVFYEYHQDSNFFYLTGFNEPGALAVIGKSADGEDHTFYLFVRPKDASAERWEGARSGLQAATDVFNADETGDIDQLATLLPPLLKAAGTLYADLPRAPHKASSTGSTGILSRLFSSPSREAATLSKLLDSHRVKPLSDLVYPLRAQKSPAEIALMRRVGRATGRSFAQTMRRQWDDERELSAFIQGEFVRHGCSGSAYVPVVAGGRNALSVHYTRNDDRIRDGDLILVDAGGEHGHYIADVTRTFPAGRRFAPAQRDLYEVVLGVQRECVALCRASAGLSLDQIHATAERRLVEGLKGLGFNMSRGAIDALFPHHVGHYIGLDVHDTPGVSRREALRAGRCVTIEPSVKVPDDDRWPSNFRSLGIQVEDSVAVGEDHPLVLSAETPKEVADIENLRDEMLELERLQKL